MSSDVKRTVSMFLSTALSIIEKFQENQNATFFKSSLKRHFHLFTVSPSKTIMPSPHEKQSTFVIAGGIREELFSRGLQDNLNLRSASALVDPKKHSSILNIHEEYLLAGASHLITCNYDVVPGRGFTPDEIVQFTRLAGRLALTARTNAESNEANFPATVCGSLPPLYPSFRYDRTFDAEGLKRTYLLIAESLWSFCDVYIAESMSSIAEAKLAFEAVEHLGKPIIVSFALNTAGGLRSGQDVIQAYEQMILFHKSRVELERETASPKLEAILFDSSQPEDIAKAIKRLSKSESILAQMREHSIHWGGYGDHISPTSRAGFLEERIAPGALNSKLDVEIFNGFMQKWKALGARYVGGCCGIGPEYIQVLRQNLSTPTCLRP
uniref:Uncharacterized protein AlNc14C191G8442 n=1 Tax=Albugo laibachii Nc14 TaxID=890382 RepID=F0WPV1_9STRA|nr:sporangia induced conserved hypothetical protein [Albugo laibachii Nc14]|eukprot:CCA23352.1 sporangia induced conserved hypothetical protein [Albugo laibachii Nc14]